MKHMRWAAALAVAVGGFTSTAFADLEFIRVEEGNSWTSFWQLDVSALTGGDFDTMVVTRDNSLSIPGLDDVTTTSDFEPSPVLANFDAQIGGGTNTANWAESSSSASTATATGDDTDFLEFSIHSTGDADDGIRFLIETYLNGQLVGEGRALYKQTSDTSFEKYTEFHLVPLPAAVWSGLALMGGIGGLLAKRRRNRMVLA